MALLEISHLAKRLGATTDADKNAFTLRVPHFTLEHGTELVLTGESGTGKTTLLNLMCGIVSADEGTITLLDTDITKLSESKRDRFRADHIGIVYQTFNLLQGFTAKENVMLGATFSNRTADAAARAKDLLARLGLGDCMNRKPSELSIGQQQRVAVARALINKPALVLADEPTANVDATNGAKIIEELRLLAQEHNASLLVVSHDTSVVRRFSRSIAIQDILSS
jgi:putative ABC transport system ATP-binding protein